MTLILSENKKTDTHFENNSWKQVQQGIKHPYTTKIAPFFGQNKKRLGQNLGQIFPCQVASFFVILDL